MAGNNSNLDANLEDPTLQKEKALLSTHPQQRIRAAFGFLSNQLAGSSIQFQAVLKGSKAVASV